jgi:hypothetical protein
MKFLLIGIEDRYFDGLGGRLGAAVQEHLGDRYSNQVFIQGSREEIARFLSNDEPAASSNITPLTRGEPNRS